MEIILFDEEACCSMSDLLVDLIDYFVDQITLLIGLVK